MFYHRRNIKHNVVVHPIHYGPDLVNMVKRKVYEEIEGTCLGYQGFIIAITSITNISPGICVDRGMSKFSVLYDAVVFRPFKNETLDGIVKHVNKLGIFVEVGPLSCFISRNSMPTDMKFYPELAHRCYKSNDFESIGIENQIRFKVIGLRFDTNNIFGIGSLADDYLGVIA